MRLFSTFLIASPKVCLFDLREGMSCPHVRAVGFDHPWADLCYATSPGRQNPYPATAQIIALAMRPPSPNLSSLGLDAATASEPFSSFITDGLRWRMGQDKNTPECPLLHDRSLHTPYPVGTGETPLKQAESSPGWILAGPSDAHNQITADGHHFYLYARRNFPVLHPNFRWRGERGVRVLTKDKSAGSVSYGSDGSEEKEWVLRSEWRLDMAYGDWEHLRNVCFHLSLTPGNFTDMKILSP